METSPVLGIFLYTATTVDVINAVNRSSRPHPLGPTVQGHLMLKYCAKLNVGLGSSLWAL